MDEDEYDKIKTRLLIKKLENSNDTNNKGDGELSVTLKNKSKYLKNFKRWH